MSFTVFQFFIVHHRSKNVIERKNWNTVNDTSNIYIYLIALQYNIFSSCTCLYPYSGVNCNTNIACAINPCFNYGTCVGQNIVPFFSCICPAGVYGQR